MNGLMPYLKLPGLLLLFFAALLLIAGSANADDFNPRKSPKKLIKDAIELSREDNLAGALVVLGSDDCRDCTALLDALESDEHSRQVESTFALVPVHSMYVSRKLLSPLPKPKQFPHLIVVSSDGERLWSQHTSVLKTNGQYDTDKLSKFLTYWQSIQTGDYFFSKRQRVAASQDIGSPWLCRTQDESTCQFAPVWTIPNVTSDSQIAEHYEEP